MKTLLVNIYGSEFYSSHNIRTLDAIRTVMTDAIAASKHESNTSSDQFPTVTNAISFVGKANKIGPDLRLQARLVLERANRNISDIPAKILNELHWHIVFVSIPEYMFEFVKTLVKDDVIAIQCFRNQDFMECTIDAMKYGGASEEDYNKMKHLASFVPAAIAKFDESKKSYYIC